MWKVWRNDTLFSTYSYDPNGNRIAHWTQSKVDSGSYDAQDRMLSYGEAQYFYTANGELQKKIIGNDTTNYTYDNFGNLITVQLSNGDRIDYLIDGQNRRVGKKLNGKTVESWLYSSQLTPIAEIDSAGNIIARFVGNYMIKNGTTYQFITDHLGSIRLVIDVNTGTVMQRLDYDEYGNVTYNSNADFTPFGFCGGIYDEQTMLVRFGARDYDATIGRWTSKDPIGFRGGEINFYEYCINDPINFVDTRGLNRFANEAMIGVYDFLKNYIRIQLYELFTNADEREPFYDKFFHCMANCEAASRGVGGSVASFLISEARELFDEYVKKNPKNACDADRDANDFGRDAGEQGLDCEKACAEYIQSLY